MPVARHCRLNNPATGTGVDVRVEFQDDEWERLNAFYREAESLGKALSGIDLHVNINVKGSAETKTIEFTGRIPPDNVLAVILHRMRPFLLKQEATYFYDICSVLGRRMENDGLRSLIRVQKEDFSGKQFQQQVSIAINDQLLNTEKNVMDWLYAEEYHRNPECKERLEALRKLLPDVFIKALFWSMLLDKVRAVLDLGRMLGFVIRADGVTCNVRDFDKSES